LLGDATEKVPASDDDGDLHAERLHVGQFTGDFVNARGLNAEALVCSQGFPGELEQNSIEGWSRHGFSTQTYQN
jgi:hypothetical protein